MTRALVLGGGGVAGIAWEAGVLVGLDEVGFDIRAWDLLVGTSAGAIVGARLLGDPDFDAFFAAQALGATADDAAAARQLAGRFGATLLRAGRLPRLGWLPGAWVRWLAVEAGLRRAVPFGRNGKAWSADPLARRVATEDALVARLGALALAARTAPPERLVEVVAGTLGPVVEWPDALVVTAVDAADGALVAIDREAGVALAQAVAASAALPMVFPPVVIRGRPYMDGGMRSSTNVPLARGHDYVLVLSPLDTRVLRAEAAALRESGARVAVVVPGPAARAAMGTGIRLLDPARRGPSALAGREEGRAAAAAIAAEWGRSFERDVA